LYDGRRSTGVGSAVLLEQVWANEQIVVKEQN
jgi:hypothetical protein